MNTEQIREKLKEKEILVAPYCHADYSWVHTRVWHEFRYATVLKEAADILEQIPEYRYWVDCVSSFLEPALARNPELLPRLRRFAEEGRLSICGTYANVRPNMVDGEAFIRNMTIGRACFAELFGNKEMTVYSDTVDVAAGHSQLPQLLNRGGYRYFRFGRPWEVLTYKKIPHEFVFRGQDGSEVIASLAPTPGFWNRDTVPLYFDEDRDKAIEALWKYEFQENHFEQFRADVFLKGNGSDDGVPLRYYHPAERIDLPALFKQLRNEGIRIRFATPEEYFQRLEAQRQQLYVLEGTPDMGDVCFNFSLGGEQSLVDKRLRGAEGLVCAEKMNAIAGMLGIRAPADFTKDWKENLFVSCHASQWSYHQDYADLTKRACRVLDHADESLGESAAALTKCMAFDPRSVAVFFNPSDTAVRRHIRLTIPTPDPEKLKLVDGFGAEVPFQPVWPYVFGFQGDVIWEWDFEVVMDLPAHGYNTLIATQGELSVMHSIPWTPPKRPEKHPVEELTVWANDVLSLQFERGNLTHIRTNNAVLTGRTPYNGIRFHQYGKEYIAPPLCRTEQIHEVRWENYEIRTEGKAVQTLALYGKVGSHPVCQLISLTAGCAEVEFETRYNWPEGEGVGFVTLEIPCDVTTLKAGIPFGREARRIDLEPYLIQNGDNGGWDDIGCVHRGQDGLFHGKDCVLAPQNGVNLALAVQSGDRYFVYDRDTGSVGHIANATGYTEADTWLENVNRTAFNCYGEHVFRHSLLVGEGMSETELQAQAEATRVPLIKTSPCGGSGILPAAASLLKLSDPRVRVSALHAQAKAWVLRVWEASGEEVTCTAELPAKVQKVQKTDLLGNVLEDTSVCVENGGLKFCLRPREIATFAIQLEEKE